MESRSTLGCYGLRGEAEAGYDNSWGTVLLFRVRSNSLRLGWRARFWVGDVRCPMYGWEEKTLEHLLEKCKGWV